MTLFHSLPRRAAIETPEHTVLVPGRAVDVWQFESDPPARFSSRTPGKRIFAKPEWQAFQEFEHLVEDYVVRRGCRLLPVSVIDVGGCPEYWKENYRLDGNPLNLRITLFHERADSWRDPRFHYLAGGYQSLSDIPDKTFDIAFSTQPFLIKDLGLQSMIIGSMKRIGARVFIRTPG